MVDSRTDAQFADRLAAARAGDLAAFGQLLEAHRHYLLTVAEQELGGDVRSKAGPSDVVQDALVEGTRLLAKFTGQQPAEFRAWLRAIMLNKLGDLHRHYRTAQRRSVERESHWPNNALADAAPTPAQLAEQTEERTRLLTALERLPNNYQEVIRLRNWENLSFAEVGEQLGKSADAARMLWGRAVEQLRLELDRL
jgi:RNA polymerase sigma-70 factor (ECF subfamily)